MIKRGSFTIETACIMPLVLFTLMGLLYLFFFVHNREMCIRDRWKEGEGLKKLSALLNREKLERAGIVL